MGRRFRGHFLVGRLAVSGFAGVVGLRRMMLLLVGLYGVLLWEMFLLFVRGMPIVVRVLRPLVLLVLRFVVHVLLLMCLLRLLLMRLRLWWLVLRL